MKKIAAVALAAVLSFGGAAPAFAAGPHNGTGRGLNCSGVCQGVAQAVIAPGLQSLNDRLGAVLAQANGNGYGAKAAQGGRQMTSPGLCANGACGTNFVDADGDGICDNYGMNCPNPNGGGNYVDANGDGVCDNFGTSRQGAGNGIGSGAGAAFGASRGTGHHGGYRR